MPLSVGLVEGAERCEEGWLDKCGGWSTKVCCGVAKCADGIEALAKCGGWATKVCCGVEKCGDVVGSEKCEDGAQGLARCGDGWSERFVGW